MGPDLTAQGAGVREEFPPPRMHANCDQPSKKIHGGERLFHGYGRRTTRKILGRRTKAEHSGPSHKGGTSLIIAQRQNILDHRKKAEETITQRRNILSLIVAQLPTHHNVLYINTQKAVVGETSFEEEEITSGDSAESETQKTKTGEKQTQNSAAGEHKHEQQAYRSPENTASLSEITRRISQATIRRNRAEHPKRMHKRREKTDGNPRDPSFIDGPCAGKILGCPRGGTRGRHPSRADPGSQQASERLSSRFEVRTGRNGTGRSRRAMNGELEQRCWYSPGQLECPHPQAVIWFPQAEGQLPKQEQSKNERERSEKSESTNFDMTVRTWSGPNAWIRSIPGLQNRHPRSSVQKRKISPFIVLTVLTGIEKPTWADDMCLNIDVNGHPESVNRPWNDTQPLHANAPVDGGQPQKKTGAPHNQNRPEEMLHTFCQLSS
ncbi:hypothetical protein C8R43DRAFT_961163 [Mycena crocata]|nr:hypothetical protein C8R43DRAFT_961163 [Mycena crocata]